MIMVLFLLSALILTRQTYVSSEYLIKTAEEINYYEETAQNINQSFQDIGMASGISKDGLEQVISKDQVKKDFDGFINASFKGKAYEVNRKEIENEVNQAVQSYAKKTNKKITQENEQAISFFLEKTSESYDQALRLPLVPTIGLRVAQFKNQIVKLIIGLLLVLTLLMGLQYFASKRRLHIMLRFVAYANLSTGLLYFLSAIVLKYFNPVHRLSLTDKNLFDLVTTYVTGTFSWLLVLGLIFIVIGSIFAILSNSIRTRLIKKSRRRELEKKKGYDMFYHQKNVSR